MNLSETEPYLQMNCRGFVKPILKIILVSFFLFAVLCTSPLLAQQTDTTTVDSTMIKEQPGQQEIDSPIRYEAQVIENDVNKKVTVLTGRALVRYQNISLKAARITVDWETNLLTAVGRWDTVWVKTESGDSIRQPKQVELPEFSEAGDVMIGEQMTFNFKTRKGRILRGRTIHDDGFYYGQALKLNKKSDVNVGHATFTTCDKEEDPHFHFWMDKMKIINKEKVVAKPVVLYMGHIPVLALPFGYFPIQKGRRSGIVFPRYGSGSREGRFLKGLGYYWAPSQYFDMKATVDYFEKSGFLFRSNLNYKVRYKLHGRISGSWTRKNFDVDGTQERRWDLNVSHTQEISPTMRLMVSGRFVSSGSFYKELSSNREFQMQKEIRSNARLVKRWGQSGKIEIFLNQTRNLETDKISETFPRISITNSIKNLIPQSKRKRGRSGKEPWYQNIRVPYQFEILGERNRYWQETTADSGYTINEGMGWNHTLRIYAQPKFFGWLTVSPSMNYQETWHDRRIRYFLKEETNTLEEGEERGFFALRTYNASLNFTTKIYGLFRSRFLKNVIMRHVMTPSVRFAYKPDFSDEKYGYYQTCEETAGVMCENDRYSESLFR